MNTRWICSHTNNIRIYTAAESRKAVTGPFGFADQHTFPWLQLDCTYNTDLQCQQAVSAHL